MSEISKPKLNNEVGGNPSASNEIYPSGPEPTGTFEPEIEADSRVHPANSELYGLLCRILFLFAVAMVTGLLFGKYVTFSDRTLGVALGSTMVAPVAIVFQLLAFLVMKSFFKAWYIYPFLAAFGIGMGNFPSRMLSEIFVPANVAVGIQLFLAYLGLFSIIYIAQILNKKRKFSRPTFIVFCSIWIVIIGLCFSMANYAKNALLIAVPIGENYMNNTVCVNGSCSKPTNNPMNSRYYTTDYNGADGSYKEWVYFQRLKFFDARKTDDNCQGISEFPNSDLRYQYQKKINGSDIYTASVVRQSNPPVSQEAQIYGPGEIEEPKTKDVVTTYYCFVKDLYVYELGVFDELPDHFFEKLQASVKPSEFDLLFKF